MSCSALGQVEEVAVAVAGRAGREAVESRGHARRRRRAGRARVPSSKKQRHCGSSGTQVEVVAQLAAGLGEDAARARAGTVRMVGPMSKRKPSSSSTAALPPSQAFFSKSDDLVAARRQRAGRRQPAQAAADDADLTRMTVTASATALVSSLRTRAPVEIAAGRR